jgi:hypothetical protein
MRHVTPLLPLAAGLLLLAAAAGILRTYGPRYRVARLLATSPAATPVAEAIQLAGGPARYIRVDGRIDSEEAFEDAARRPLVFRRTRLQARGRGGWRTFEDGREQVLFEVGDGIQAIAVDADALGDGLVVIPRESAGIVADLADRAPAGVDPGTAARALVEQISAIEHAIVLGVPVMGPDGGARLTAGLGRPLVLTTLEVPEAMRLIAGGDRIRPALVAACIALGSGLVVLAAAWAVLSALAGPAR